jgi:hypothetical protein
MPSCAIAPSEDVEDGTDVGQELGASLGLDDGPFENEGEADGDSSAATMGVALVGITDGVGGTNGDGEYTALLGLDTVPGGDTVTKLVGTWTLDGDTAGPGDMEGTGDASDGAGEGERALVGEEAASYRSGGPWGSTIGLLRSLGPVHMPLTTAAKRWIPLDKVGGVSNKGSACAALVQLANAAWRSETPLRKRSTARKLVLVVRRLVGIAELAASQRTSLMLLVPMW